MRILRWLIDGLINALCKFFAPKPKGIRPPQLQADVDAQTQHIKLYHFNACPFCLKVRWAIKRLELHIEMRDIQRNATYERELIEEGGYDQVPCLRIETADKVQWLYESQDIVAYLRQRFPVN